MYKTWSNGSYAKVEMAEIATFGYFGVVSGPLMGNGEAADTKSTRLRCGGQMTVKCGDGTGRRETAATTINRRECNDDMVHVSLRGRVMGWRRRRWCVDY